MSAASGSWCSKTHHLDLACGFWDGACAIAPFYFLLPCLVVLVSPRRRLLTPKPSPNLSPLWPSTRRRRRQRSRRALREKGVSSVLCCGPRTDNRAPSFKTVLQVAVGMVTRAAVEAASICANLLVVYCRNSSSLPLSTLTSAFRRRSSDSSSWIRSALASKGFRGDPPVHEGLHRPIQRVHDLVAHFLHRVVRDLLPTKNSRPPRQVVRGEPQKAGRPSDIPFSRRKRK